jgi:hypothetical protein
MTCSDLPFGTDGHIIIADSPGRGRLQGTSDDPPGAQCAARQTCCTRNLGILPEHGGMVDTVDDLVMPMISPTQG